MIRFDKTVYRITSCMVSIILFYWICGWNVQEPCMAFGMLGIFLGIQDWMIDKRRALQRGRANRAGIAIKSIT